MVILQQWFMVILLQFFKFTSVVYSVLTFCIAYMFSVHNKFNPSLSKALLTVGLPDNSCTSSLVKLHRDGTETLEPFTQAGHATGLPDWFCGQVLMEGARTFHRRSETLETESCHGFQLISVELMLSFYSPGVVPAVAWIRQREAGPELWSQGPLDFCSLCDGKCFKAAPPTRALPCVLLHPFILTRNSITLGLLTSCTLTCFWKTWSFLKEATTRQIMMTANFWAIWRFHAL